MEKFIRVGVITTTHGLKGEVKVYPTTDDVSRFEDLPFVYLKINNFEKTLEIESVKYFKQLVILKFKGLDRIEDVETLRNVELYVDREHAVALEEGEYYIADLIGMKVYTDDGGLLGELTDVIETGANDVYQIRTTGNREVLVPAIDDCIVSVDIEECTMIVHLLPGLID